MVLVSMLLACYYLGMLDMAIVMEAMVMVTVMLITVMAKIIMALMYKVAGTQKSTYPLFSNLQANNAGMELF